MSIKEDEEIVKKYIEIKERHKDSGEWWNTKYELERILDSQFRVTRNLIEEKDLRTINIIHLGKVKPSKWFTHNRELVIKRKQERDARYQEYRKGLVQLSNQEQGRDKGDNIREEENL